MNVTQEDYLRKQEVLTLWGQIVENFLTIKGGILDNDTTIGWKDSSDSNVTNLIQYNSQNAFSLGYGQRTKGSTWIYGKTIKFATNGATARLAIDENGVATFANDIVLANAKRIGWANSGGTTVANLLQYTSDNKLYLGYGQSTVNDTNIYGKVVNIMTNGNTARLSIDSSGNTTLSGKLSISSGGLDVTGDALFHSNIVLYNPQAICGRTTDATPEPVSLLQYNAANEVIVGYGNVTRSTTRIFGKSITFTTNGSDVRMTIDQNGNVIIPGEIECPTISTLKSGIGQVLGIAQDNAENLILHEDRISGLESYFNGSMPKHAVTALSFSGVTISYTIGGLTTLNWAIPNASSSAAGVVSTSSQTFAGVKTFSNTGEQQIVLSYNGSGNSHIALGFANADGTKSEIYVSANNADSPYYKQISGTAYKMYHAGNSNKSDVSWTAYNITAYGTIKPNSNNSQDLGGHDNVFANLYIDNIVTPAGNGMRFGANNGPFRWYAVRTNFSSYTPTMELSTSGNLSTKKDIMAGGDVIATGGVAAGGICDLSLY